MPEIENEVLETKRLLLRPIKENDAAVIFECSALSAESFINISV